MYNFFSPLFGLEITSEALTFMHLSLRAFLVYFIGMLLIRIQGQFMGINTPFTYMLNFIMGSLLANAIVGDGAYFPTLGMCLFIAVLNWIIALLCYYAPAAERFFKGEADLLVKDGKILWKNMRRNLITKDELMESVHKFTLSDDLSRVKKAYFENSGEITIILE